LLLTGASDRFARSVPAREMVYRATPWPSQARNAIAAPSGDQTGMLSLGGATVQSGGSSSRSGA
jgi:hypothetical protein